MYQFEDKTLTYLNDEIDIRMSDMTSKGLIKSETEYNLVIENLLKTVDEDILRITDTKKYIVKNDDIVSSKQLNDLFNDLITDIKILHKNLEDIHNVIDITLDRNKLFYRRIKNKISSMWKEIQKFRETSFTIEQGTYTFFESFSENSNMLLSNLTVDKKSGTLVLSPSYIDIFNHPNELSSVEMTLYPVAGKDTGVYDTTNPNNKFTSDRYTLLRDGLWKVQVLAADIPELVLDLYDNGNKIYKGLIASLDITFNSTKLINQIDIDPYGDFKTEILAIRYTIDDITWYNISYDNYEIVKGRDTDNIVFRNFTPVNVKKLKIIFYQPNYQIIHKLLNKVDESLDQVVKNLIENKFNKINYNYKNTNNFPKIDNSNENNTYDEVMNIIETGGSIESLESKLMDMLIPKPIDITSDISNWKLFNIGAWSIEPKNIGYNPNSNGIYISHDPKNKESGFKINKGSATYAKLYTKQDEPANTSIEWSLLIDVDGVNYTNVPILPNNDIWRTETVKTGDYKPLELSSNRINTNYSNLYTIIKLDFPIHDLYKSMIEIYENGNLVQSDNMEFIEFYNSTELYIPAAELNNGSMYTIKYIPAVNDTCRCWTISPTKTTNALDIGYLSVFATKNLAEEMIKYLDNDYTINSHLCTISEYNNWFSNGSIGICIDKSYNIIYKNPILLNHNEIDTKLGWLLNTDIPSPYSESSDMYTWNNIISAPPLVNRNL